MAIKKISFNKEGLVSEEVVEKSTIKPPSADKVKAVKKGTSRASAPKKRKAKSATPKAGAVKITAVAEKKPDLPPGKSLIEKDVIKFVCPRCSSERVGGSRDARLKCGLCGAEMKLVK